MDNFSIYGEDETIMLQGTAWSAVSMSTLLNDPDGVSGGKVFQIKNSTSFQPSLIVPTATDVINVAFRWYVSTQPENSSRCPDVEFRDVDNSVRYIVRQTVVGGLELVRTDGAGSVIDNIELAGFTTVATSGAVLSNAVWNHVEVSLNRTTGVYTIWVEGVSVLNGTDVSPATGNTSIVAFRENWLPSAGSSNANIYIKDLVISDNNGSVNNAQIGSVQVVTLSPNGDVSSGWTRSSGSTDYELVDELTPDDANYIEAGSTLPAASIMTLSNLPPDIVGIRALQTMVRALKTDGGDATLKVSLVSGVDEDAGATHAVPTSAQYEWDISEFDPATAALWTPIAVDAVNIKIDRTL